MIASTILADLRCRGVAVSLEDGRLRLGSIGQRLPATLLREMRRQAPEMVRLLQAESGDPVPACLTLFGPELATAPADEDAPSATTNSWDAGAVALAEWFDQALSAGRLMREPFELEPGRPVADPQGLYQALAEAIMAGPAGPWACVVPEDLALLKAVATAKREGACKDERV